MTSEKWVVVEMSYDEAYVDDVYGIFDSEEAAKRWAREEYYSKPFEVRRIKKAVRDEWA